MRKLPLTLEEMYSGCEKKVVIERSIVDGASRRALALKEVYLVLVPVAVNEGAQLVYPGMSHIQWLVCACANLVRTCVCTVHACMGPAVYEMHTPPTGLGHEEAGCERAGDVILVVSQEPHALFRRCGDDLLHEVCSCACVC